MIERIYKTELQMSLPVNEYSCSSIESEISLIVSNVLKQSLLESTGTHAYKITVIVERSDSIKLL